MKPLLKFLIGIPAVIHFGVLSLEMFFWSMPLVQDKFQDFTPEALAAILAGNQGLSNGFLSLGLLWGLLDKEKSVSIWTFFLGCIAVAGIYGSFSLGRPTAILVQTIPAVLALILLFLNHRSPSQPVPTQESRL